MKIALVHDYLVQDGGAEKVLKALQEIFPEAPVFVLVYDHKKINFLTDKSKIVTSFLQRMPLGVRKYQWWISLMPLATESHDLMNYDLVISSASSFAKGVITNPNSVHVCYCYTPTRYLWNDTHSYLQELRVNPIIKIFLPLILKRLRIWDRLASERVDHYITTSKAVENRINKYYKRGSSVIYPPVEVEKFHISDKPKKYFLAGGRLVPYKRIDLAVKAFSRLGIPLKVFGVGPEMKNLKKIAKNNIEFVGKVSDEMKSRLFSDCLAYINPQEEDFGITAIEAMASGRPVIAYRGGGAIETVKEGVTGEFFEEQWWEELADRIIRFKEERYDPKIIREYALTFSTENFKTNIKDFLSNLPKNDHTHNHSLYENRS